MLSRLRSGTALQGLRNVGLFKVRAVSAGSSAVGQQQSSDVTTSEGKRDLINFPRPQLSETVPEVRLAFLPKSWFDFMYPKTGVTGPYMLLVGLSTYMFSKEIIVISPEFYSGLSFVFAISFIHYSFGSKIKEALSKMVDEQVAEHDNAFNQSKENLKVEIENIEKMKWEGEGVISFLPEVKRENVYLQMEAAYRSRLTDISAAVKRCLDYQVEKENIQRQIAQKNMVQWIIKNVEKSITPDLKKKTLQQCIANLNTLTATA